MRRIQALADGGRSQYSHKCLMPAASRLKCLTCLHMQLLWLKCVSVLCTYWAGRCRVSADVHHQPSGDVRPAPRRLPRELAALHPHAAIASSSPSDYTFSLFSFSRRDPMFSHSGTIPAYDRQTQVDSTFHAIIKYCGKIANYLVLQSHLQWSLIFFTW